MDERRANYAIGRTLHTVSEKKPCECPRMLRLLGAQESIAVKQQSRHRLLALWHGGAVPAFDRVVGGGGLGYRELSPLRVPVPEVVDADEIETTDLGHARMLANNLGPRKARETSLEMIWNGEASTLRKLAEGVRFELTRGFHPCRFSRPVP